MEKTAAGLRFHLGSATSTGARLRTIVLGIMLSAAAAAIDLDDVASIEDSVDVGESGQLNGAVSDGGIEAVQTAGDFVGTFTLVQTCEEGLMGPICTAQIRTVTVRRDTGSALEVVATYANLPDTFESYELTAFDGCLGADRCDRLLIAFVDRLGEDRLGVQVFDVFDPVPGRLVAGAEFDGSAPFDFSFAASQKTADSAVVDIFFGLPEEGPDGIVRAIRVDGATTTITDLEPPPALRRRAKGLASARFGASVEATPGGLCIGQSPLTGSPIGDATEASISLASSIFANLGTPAYSTAFGKFPLGQSVETSGSTCASSAPGEVTLCDGNCSNPTRFVGTGGEVGFGRSVSLTGEELLVGGGDEGGGAVYQYAFGNAAFLPLATVSSSNPAFGAQPLAATSRALVATLAETRLTTGTLPVLRTRTDLLRIDGVRVRLFGNGFEAPIGQ